VPWWRNGGPPAGAMVYRMAWLGWIITIAACLASVARGGAYSWPIGRREMVATQTGYIPPWVLALT